jgi:polyvinyl alcohol dehydrogenase (cytochrome)
MHLLARSRWRAVAITAALFACLAGVRASEARVVCEPDSAPGGEWRMMGRDLTAARTQTFEHVLDRTTVPLLAPAWTFDANAASGEVHNEITGYPIVADGCVYVGSSTGLDRPGWVFALNADGGDLAWKAPVPGGVFSTLAVADGRVYAFASIIGRPTLVALDSRTGAELWRTVVDTQAGSDAVSSPVVFDGMVWVGVSGTLAEGDESQRFLFRGASVILDAATGQILHKEYAIPDGDFRGGDGDAGAAIWSTVSIDPATKYGYVGTGNPFNYVHENRRTNAVIKIDFDKTRTETFGRVVGWYKGQVEQYAGPLAEFNGACDEEAEENPVLFGAGFECQHLDLDFGAQPNIITDRSGRTLVGIGQKSGVYHVFDPSCTGDDDGYGACEMKPVWQTVMGVPSPVGGIVGTAAFDGTALYVGHSIAGYIASLDRDDGHVRWLSPVADGVHWGNPITAANGVVYTPDLKGFLDAYDAGTGAPLLHRPISLGANTGLDPTFTWGGATVARNTVFVSVGVGLTSAGSDFPSMPDGFVVAFRPMKVGF